MYIYFGTILFQNFGCRFNAYLNASIDSASAITFHAFFIFIFNFLKFPFFSQAFSDFFKTCLLLLIF